jgi:hypothetical protein
MIGRVVWIVFVVALGLSVYLIGASAIRKFHIPPPPDPDPEQLRPVDLRFRCPICGAEVTMTAASDTIELEAPRHCREDMDLVAPVDD